MANILIFKDPPKEPEYLESVNTPDYLHLPNILVNPDISVVKTVPIKYWKRDNDKVVEMTPEEKEAWDLPAKQVEEAAQLVITEINTTKDELTISLADWDKGIDKDAVLKNLVKLKLLE